MNAQIGPEFVPRGIDTLETNLVHALITFKVFPRHRYKVEYTKTNEIKTIRVATRLHGVQAALPF
jgi:hypothetical protein